MLDKCACAIFKAETEERGDPRGGGLCIECGRLIQQAGALHGVLAGDCRSVYYPGEMCR